MSYHKVGTMSAIAIQQALLKRHDAREITLSEWEYKFLNNIWIKAVRNELTDRQRKVIDTIAFRYGMDVR